MTRKQAPDRQKAFIDTIPEIQGREFQHELPLAGDGDDVREAFMTPIATGESVLHVHTAEIQADRGIFPRIFQRMLSAGGYNQNSFATAHGWKRQTINQLTRGYRANPSMELFLRFAAACGCRVLIEYPRRITGSGK